MFEVGYAILVDQRSAPRLTCCRITANTETEFLSLPRQPQPWAADDPAAFGYFLGSDAPAMMNACPRYLFVASTMRLASCRLLLQADWTGAISMRVNHFTQCVVDACGVLLNVGFGSRTSFVRGWIQRLN